MLEPDIFILLAIVLFMIFQSGPNRRPPTGSIREA